MGANNDEQNRQLFIGGLNFQTTNKTLREFFEQWGEVEAAFVKKHPQTKESRGFGFVFYSQSYMVHQAMSNTPHRIDGREVKTKLAIPLSKKLNKQLFICDLNFQTTNKSLKEFFEQWGEVKTAAVKRHPQTNRSRGYGFVTYSQSYMVDQAMSNTPHIIDGREVETKIALPRSVINEPNNTVDVKKVFISGINMQSEHDLFVYFRQFGNITFLKIVKDNYTGKIKGFGFVKYDVKASADKALSIRSHLVAGGKLNIRKAFSRRIYDHESRGYVGGCHYFDNRNNLYVPQNYEANRQLFIGGLNFHTTNKTLRVFFGQWGEVEAAFVKKYPQTNLSRGFGFVIYSQSYMVHQAMSNTPHRIDGREVETKLALPYSRRQNKQLFIGNLHFQTTYKSLKEFFEQWGEVEAVVVKRHPQTNRSRGFGFITYSQSYMVDQAMSNTPHIIDGREVETKIALPRSINELNITVDVKKVFISGINMQSEHDLFVYFRQFGNITFLKIVKDNYTGKIKGFGFVKYDVKASADKALSIGSHLVAGGKLNVKKALSRKIYIQRSHGYVGGCHHLGNNNKFSVPWGGFYNNNNINIFY